MYSFKGALGAQRLVQLVDDNGTVSWTQLGSTEYQPKVPSRSEHVATQRGFDQVLRVLIQRTRRARLHFREQIGCPLGDCGTLIPEGANKVTQNGIIPLRQSDKFIGVFEAGCVILRAEFADGERMCSYTGSRTPRFNRNLSPRHTTSSEA